MNKTNIGVSIRRGYDPPRFVFLGSAADRLRARSLLLALLRDRHFLGVAGVQDHRQEVGPGLAARVPGHPVHRPRRLVEHFPGLVGLDRLVVDGVLVFALQDVAEHRAGVAVGESFWPGSKVTSTTVALAAFPSSFSMMSRWDSWVTFTWPFPVCWARVIPPTPMTVQTARARNVRYMTTKLFICEPPVENGLCTRALRIIPMA